MRQNKLALWVGEQYKKYDWFSQSNPLNCDGLFDPFIKLKERIESAGGMCQTQDFYLRSNIRPDYVLFMDMPAAPVDKLLGEWNNTVRKWLCIQECEVIIPQNWDVKKHLQFEKVFTWHDGFVDDEKYFKLNFAHTFPTSIPHDLATKKKFCALIAGNKKSDHPLELYSKRVEAIRWFETNHPEEFDLYGVGWDEHLFTGAKPIRALNRIKFLKKAFSPHFPSYRGKVATKKPVLENYRFCICYENAAEIPGYITEKIFDCFVSGVIPVYWGAPNILDYIPSDCFLDKREFQSYGSLYSCMKNMGDEEYLRRLSSISSFLSGPGARPFSVDTFANTIVGAMRL